jgi:transcriptional regulator with XRE-family HTH domain
MDSVTANMPAFGVFVREQRLAQGFTLRQFAQRVGIAASYESTIESGAAPPPTEEVIGRIARALGLQEASLMARAGKLPAATLAWFWSQPIVQDTLGCASGLTEADAKLFVLTVVPALAGYTAPPAHHISE